MGVPKFFRWVTDRYPSILTGVVDEAFNTPEIDNLYLDMNGIIHNCSHDNDKLSVALDNATIIMKVILEMDRLVSVMVKPLAIVFIAVDGVAPRAKLNQQRSRRFRSARDRLTSIQKEKEKDSNFKESEVFDSNCITPGTAFMTELSVGIRKFIATKVKDIGSIWNRLTVYFSGSEVPGEGEHKIMSFIREQRASSNYKPNVRHCMNGSDADMIMLSLATHEPYFLVLRDILETKSFSISKGGKLTNRMKQIEEMLVSQESKAKKPKPMQFVRIHILREYIVAELLEGLNQEQFNIERIIDDFIFLTFFVGNDFLPGLPALNIGDSAFDVIFDAYKTVLASFEDTEDWGDTTSSGAGSSPYLVDGDVIDLEKLEMIVNLIGVTELSMYVDNELIREFNRNKKLAEEEAKLNSCEVESNISSSDSNTEIVFMQDDTIDNVTPKEKEETYKNQYYQRKLQLDITTSEGYNGLREVVSAYLQGLHWCLSYYSKGCVSWSWYYPYHYGPFLHDLTNLLSADMKISFELSEPFTPFQQLLACLPSSSCSLLPQCYHTLMQSPTSPLISYYPTVFKTDRNGKKQEYESVVLLPFIDRQILLNTEREYCRKDLLTEIELKRNTFGVTYRYQFSFEAFDVGITEIPLHIEPGECFVSELIAGTASSLPGYHSLKNIEVKDVYMSKSNKTYNNAAKGKKKTNFYSKQQNNKDEIDCFAPIDSEKNDPYLPDEFTIRLLCDENSSIFLCDLCKQIESLSTEFRSVLKNKCTGSIYGGGGLFNQFVVNVLSNCNLLNTKVNKANPTVVVKDSVVDVVRSEQVRTQLREIVSKVVHSSPVVQCSILPTCRVDSVPLSIYNSESKLRYVERMNLVSINIERTSDYERVEQSIVKSIRSDLFGGTYVNDKKHFYKSKMSIVIGYYSGEDSKGFQQWLNNELKNVKEIIPVMEGCIMELVYANNVNNVNNDSSNEEYSGCVNDSVYQYSFV